MTKPTKPLCAIGCGAPTAAGYICRGCTDKIRRDLSDVVDRDLVGELVTSYTRQARLGSATGGSRSANTSLPWDDRAAVSVKSLRELLASWASKAAADCGGEPGPDAQGAAAFLLLHIDWITTSFQGVAAWRSLHAAIGRALYVIDRPPPAWYAGPCTAPLPDDPDGYCAVDLYARPESAYVACRKCGTRYDVADRRAWLLQACMEYLAHASLIARALTSMLETTVTPDRIWQWAHRGRLIERGRDPQTDRPLYRIGDVIERLNEDAEAQARRAAKREAS